MGAMFNIFCGILLLGFSHDLRASECKDHTCADRPAFTPSHLVVKFGDAFSVTCTVCLSCAETLKFERALGSHKIHGNTLEWTVKNMTEWDPQTTCYYDYSEEESCCSVLPVTVYSPPDSVSISFVDHSGPMSEGRPYTLQCKVQNVAPVKNLTVTFYKGQTALGQQQSNNTNKKPVSETFTLDIRPSKEDDGVQFWCEAKLELGPEGPKPPPVVESQRVSATVRYEPQLDRPSRSELIYTIREGKPLQLTCSAAGNPGPSYTWEVPSAKRGRFTSNHLVIESVTPEDEGQYVCTASNTMGKATLTYKVTVQGLQLTTASTTTTTTTASPTTTTTTTTTTTPSSRTTVPNSSRSNASVQTLMMCILLLSHVIKILYYTCTDRPVFNPSNLVVKYQDPTSVTCTVCPTCQSLFNLERALGHHTRNGSTLKWTVKNMTEWDPKTTCFYTSADDVQCCTLLPITVYSPPDSVSISFVDHSGPMSEGRPYTLQCKVQNVAPVKNLTVTFYKGQTALGQQQSNNTNKKPVSETFTLVIRPSKEDSRVKFWCEAKLELGPEGPKPPPVVESQRVSATVRFKPQLEVPSHPGVITVTEGEALELSCMSVGDPMPSYTWSSPPAISPQTNISNITIKSVGSEHAGEYTCTASNNEGAVALTYSVTVKANIIPYILIAAAACAILLFLVFPVVYLCYYKKKRMGQYNLKEVLLMKTHHVAVPVKD
ncbi:vascular cell adhesion protein 1-like [Echeneis naucrates]|uniref:vascular cell adhesion protein 1-like n=1 Tax=Echeneis naucrates TaxID=173247 RepID=UPI0011140DE9|nr:vascular cell adhesion protein 1-like [Echeneis naucrates]